MVSGDGGPQAVNEMGPPAVNDEGSVREEKDETAPSGTALPAVVEPGPDQIRHGPTSPEQIERGPFNSRQLARIDEALTLSSRETGMTFSLYVGELAEPTRATAEQRFNKLGGLREPVLIAVSPGQRVLHIVTGPESARRLPNRACALAALSMRASFTSGDLTGGIVNGLRMLADSAGQRS